MNRSCRRLLILLPLSILIGCGVTQPIRTIPAGEVHLTGSFGGGIIPFGGIAIPVPYLTAGAQYGYSDAFTVFGNGHLTAALFKDVGLDLGGAYRAVRQEGIVPELTLAGRGYFFWDAVRGSTTRLYPSLSAAASYQLSERSLLYFGTEGLYQQSTSDLFLAPFAGYTFPVHERWVLQLETKWLAANKDMRHGIFEGAASVGGYGNVGIYCGVQWEAFR
ncbi:MAG: hypothetical protein HUU02_10580 [Bacteroidetes bacterium]|nr:hypothetical protein [Bacteroidota bacterium]